MNIKRIVIPVLISVVALALSLMVSTSNSSAQQPGPIEATGNQSLVTSSSSGLEVVGQIGGAVRAVNVKGTRAYVGVGVHLEIVDVSNPNAPFFLGQTGVLSGLIEDVAASGNYAYVADGGNDLRIFDVSDPTTPLEIGLYTTPGHVYDIDISGSTAYVADGQGGLRLISLTTPTTPTEISAYDTSGEAIEVTISGALAYLIDDSGSFDGSMVRIISTTNPVSLTQLGAIGLPWSGYLHDVAVVGNYAYLAAYGIGDAIGILEVIDVSNPSSPAYLTHLTTPGYALDIAASSGSLYLSDGYTGLLVFNIANSGIPVQVGELRGEVYETAVSGAYAYAATGYADFLRIVSISNPAAPQEVSVYRVPGSVLKVAADSAYAYYAGRDGFNVVSLANPTAPRIAGILTGTRWPEDLVVSSTTAYLGHSYVGEVQVLDISDVSNPTRVSSFQPKYMDVLDVKVSGAYAYVANGWGGLRVADVSDPHYPVEVGVFTSTNNYIDWASGVAISGNLAYLADRQYIGLWIIDVSSASNPTGISLYSRPDWGEWASQVAVSGNYAYVLGGPLRVIDVSEPLSPTHVGTLSVDFCCPNNLTTVGDYLFTASGSVHIINVADPSNPFEIDGYAPIGSASDVAVYGHYLYVAAGDGGMFIVWFGFPAIRTISTAGGSLNSTSDSTAYSFPANTFTETVVITHTARYPGNMPAAGNLIGIDHFFDVTAVYSSTGLPAQPTQPYTLTVQYTDQEKGSAIENTLGLYYWNGLQWVNEPSSVVDAANNTVTATPNHFSLWAVLGETNRVFLPLIAKK